MFYSSEEGVTVNYSQRISKFLSSKLLSQALLPVFSYVSLFQQTSIFSKEAASSPMPNRAAAQSENAESLNEHQRTVSCKRS